MRLDASTYASRRRLAGVAALLLASVVTGVAAGCGSTSVHSVRNVERAFFAAGAPFQAEWRPNVRPNSYLRPLPAGESYLLPRPVLAAKLLSHVNAILGAVSSKTFTGQFAFVFDSTKSADAALRAAPLSKWLEGNHPAIRVRLANVIIVAAPGGDAVSASRIRHAIAILQRR